MDTNNTRQTSESAEPRYLLQQAVNEIKLLRRQNEMMKARLEMFDAVNAMLHIQVVSRDECMSPDLVYEIEGFIKRPDMRY